MDVTLSCNSERKRERASVCERVEQTRCNKLTLYNFLNRKRRDDKSDAFELSMASRVRPTTLCWFQQRVCMRDAHTVCLCVSVCVRVCMFVCEFHCFHTCVCVFTCACLHACVCVAVCVSVSMCVNVCQRVLTCANVRVRERVGVWV